MKTKNEILEYIYKERMVQKYGHKILVMKREAEAVELTSEVYLHICELPEELLLNLEAQDPIEHKNLTAYIRTYVMQQLSPTGATRNIQKLYETECISLEDWNLGNKDDIN